VQLAASIVATLHGTPIAAEVPASVAGALPLEELPVLDEELPDELTMVPPDEPPLEPDEGTMFEPEPEDAGDPCTTITFSPGAAEHAAARPTTQTPNRNGVLMRGEVPRRAPGQASDHA
jgi:hypothetical protein